MSNLDQLPELRALNKAIKGDVLYGSEIDRACINWLVFRTKSLVRPNTMDTVQRNLTETLKLIMDNC